MSYTVLNSKLQTVAVGFQSLSAAAKDTIETKPQDRVWFVEDDSGDIVAIVHRFVFLLIIHTPLRVRRGRRQGERSAG